MQSRRGATVTPIVNEPGQSEWNPQLGLWRLQDVLGARRVAARPPITAALARQTKTPAPRLGLLWRGPARPGDSLGNVTYSSLAALADLGLARRLSFVPVKDLPIAPPSAETSPRVREVARLRRSLAGALVHLTRERLHSRARALVEVQTPSAARATLRACVRLVYSEFGPFRQKYIRRSDLLWVPSRYVEDRARAAFPENDILVVPLGIDPEIFHPEGERLPSLAPGPFRFLYVGTTISRKGFDLVLEAFAAEHRHMPDAELVLKLQPTWQGFLHELPECSLPGVRVIREPLSTKAMAALYRSCDVLLAPSRAESFHMGVLEAMACGLPAIVPDGSAMDDFCPAEARYSVAADEVVVDWTKGRTLRFLEPDPASLREAMLAAYADRALCAAKGETAAEAARLYTWTNAMRLLLTQILAAPQCHGAPDAARVPR